MSVNNEAEIYAFLKKCEVAKGQEFSHTSLGKPRRSYYISGDFTNDFLNKYKNAFKNDTLLHLTEKHSDIAPILIDLDFRKEIENINLGEYPDPSLIIDTKDFCNHVYKHGDIEIFIKLFMDNLVDYLDIRKLTTIDIFLQEKCHAVRIQSAKKDKNKEEYIKNVMIKDGIHIVIPDIITCPYLQFIIRNKILKNHSNIFDKLNLSNNLSDIYDEAIIKRNNWLMYGSCKEDSHCQAYYRTNIYRYNVKEKKLYVYTSANLKNQEFKEVSYNMTLDKDKYECKVVKSLVDKKGHYYTSSIKKTQTEDFRARHVSYIELFSIRNKIYQTVYKKSKIQEIEEYKSQLLTIEKPIKIEQNQILIEKNENSYEDLDYIRSLISCLNERRADVFDEWISLCWCLRNIHVELEDDFIEFSKKSVKFNETECIKQWNSHNFTKNGLYIGSLVKWAKQDNLERYELIKSHRAMTIAGKDIRNTDHDIATVIVELYKEDFISVYPTRGTPLLYYFSNNRWYLDKGGVQLLRIMSTQVHDIYTQLRQKAFEQNNKTAVSICEKIQDRLKSNGGKNAIWQQVAQEIKNDKFEEKLNTNPYLLGFENGVYDLQNHVFREGRPEDYINMSVGYDYIKISFDDNEDENDHNKIYNEDEIINSEIMEFFRKLFPDDDLREYVLRSLGRCLSGITEEIIYLAVGIGCHAIDSGIMMYDGSIKKVQDIVIGDKLMGDDGTERNVLELHRGKELMYRVIPAKGDPFVVNKSHKLAFKITSCEAPKLYNKTKIYVTYVLKLLETYEDGVISLSERRQYFNNLEDAQIFLEKIKSNPKVCQYNDIIEIRISNYILNNLKKFNLYLSKSNLIPFEEKDLDLDPYILGAWLGDETSQQSAITSMDNEILDYIKEIYNDHEFREENSTHQDHAITLHITNNPNNRNKIKGTNKFLQALQNNNLIKNKHIPFKYKTSSINQRYNLLAGFIDINGYYNNDENNYEITLKSEQLIDNLIYVARSLGINAYKYETENSYIYKGEKQTGIYYRTSLYGQNIENIPVKLKRNKLNYNNHTIRPTDVLKFKLEKLEVDDYYGFHIDGNHRFIDSNHFITCQSNGKSILSNLMKEVLGDYFRTVNISMFLNKRIGVGVANPELMSTVGVRMLTANEPEDNEKLNSGYIKELTGGDPVTCRGLYQDAVTFKPQFKLWLLSNHLPTITDTTEGIWRRMKVVQFKSRFVKKEQVDINDSYSFEADKSISQKFDRWKYNLINILIYYYKKSIDYGIHQPDSVDRLIKEYREDNDIMMQFLNELLHKTNNEKDKIKIPDLMDKYKKWFKLNNSNGYYKMITQVKEFIKQIETRINRSVKNSHIPYIVGYIYKSEIDVDEDASSDDSEDNSNTTDKFEIISEGQKSKISKISKTSNTSNQSKTFKSSHINDVSDSSDNELEDTQSISETSEDSEFIREVEAQLIKEENEIIKIDNKNRKNIIQNIVEDDENENNEDNEDNEEDEEDEENTSSEEESKSE